jgi:hypothetical protein
VLRPEIDLLNNAVNASAVDSAAAAVSRASMAGMGVERLTTYGECERIGRGFILFHSPLNILTQGCT